MGLWQRIRDEDPNALVAQRLKRLESIQAKLMRFETMNLSQMQDIGGCRAVLRDVSSVYDVDRSYARSRPSRFRHKLAGRKDYIANPKPDGYRGIHLVYKFKSAQSPRYNDLRIEIQLRSRLQHAWATAVETVDTLTKQSIKASKGTPDWHRFFALMGSAIALREKTPLVTGTPQDADELRSELRSLSTKLDVARTLTTYGKALKETEGTKVKQAKYFLLELRPAEGSVKVTEFQSADVDEATKAYLETEKAIKSAGLGAEAVLVSVDSLESLRAAYPNYFLDTELFLEALVKALGQR